MPVKKTDKPISFGNVANQQNYPATASAGESGRRIANFQSAAIFAVDSKGKILKHSYGIFLLNPESWEDNKTSNWVQQNIPGQSDPVLQWVSSGARTVAFDALVTNDTSNFDFFADKPGSNGEKSSIDNSLQAVASIATKFFGVANPAKRDDTKTSNAKILDISERLNYYRSFLYPEYNDLKNPKSLQQSPPLIVLVVGNSLTNIKYADKISNNDEVWVITDLKIKITKQLPNLSPMEAIVSFQLMQYNIKSFSRSRFL